MDFSLSEEQQLLQQTVRDFAQAEIAPHAREWDEKQAFPREVFTKLGALGLMLIDNFTHVLFGFSSTNIDIWKPNMP